MVTQPHKRHVRASIEIDFNGAHRTIPSEPCSSSSSSEGGDTSPTAEQAEPGTGTAAQAAAEQPPRLHGHHHHKHEKEHGRISAQEWGNMALLVLLYAMQGIPLGLTMGAM